MESPQSEQQKEKQILKYEEITGHLRQIQPTNIHIMLFPEGEEREKMVEGI